MTTTTTTISAPTIERGRRCQNCLSFNNGPIAIRHYKQKRFADMQQEAKEVLQRDGMTKAQVQELLDAARNHEPGTPAPFRIQRQSDVDPHSKLAENYTLGDDLIRRGQLGICLKNNTAGDFVHAHHLCGNDPASPFKCQWTEKFKPDGAEKHDESAAEARKRLGLD